VDRHVVDALFGLLDDGVAEDLPRQFVGLAIHFLECLVDRHGPDRHRAVADDPFPGGVDVLTCRQVHHCVGAPRHRPRQLLDLLGDARRHRAVSDVGVHLHQEPAADDHRLGLRVVDVARDDGPAGSDLAAVEFDLAALALGNEFHLLGHDALLRIVHLRDVPATARPAPCALPLVLCRATPDRRAAVVDELGLAAGVLGGIRALLDPGDATRGESHRRIGAGSFGGVPVEGLAIAEGNPGDGYLQVAEQDAGVGFVGGHV
jgi:hypothetical protein